MAGLSHTQALPLDERGAPPTLAENFSAHNICAIFGKGRREGVVAVICHIKCAASNSLCPPHPLPIDQPKVNPATDTPGTSSRG